jgi:deoxyribodipyrimidine photo-lyase
MHDRPFIERDIFGKIRYMSENGLKRKFDIEKYYKMWSIK